MKEKKLDTGDKKPAGAEAAQDGRENVPKKKPRGLKGRLAELEEELERVSSESAENYDRLLRARAEFENLKKRTARDIELIHQRAGERLVSRLLPVMDDLEKAIEAAGGSPQLGPMKEGLDLIHKGLMEALTVEGVRAIDPVGESFDPNYHEAILQKETRDADPGTVLEVLQRGYLMNGLVLRAAKVVVAAGEKD